MQCISELSQKKWIQVCLYRGGTLPVSQARKCTCQTPLRQTNSSFNFRVLNEIVCFSGLVLHSLGIIMNKMFRD